MDVVQMWRICTEWCGHPVFQNSVLLFACRNWRNTAENLSGNGLMVENRIRSFPNTKQESSPVSRYIWTKVLDIHVNIFARERHARARAHTHTSTRIRTCCFKPGVWNSNCTRAKQIVLRFQVGRISFQAIEQAFYLKLITTLIMFNAFDNKVTVC
jgi:hypothetical protein